ncbi:hypothetical protein C3986_03312 [Escherichia coli]|nr:hypothetical protein C3986_03312 [Escherichia coli]
MSQRIVQRLFTCQRIKHCRGKVRIIPQCRRQFVQCIQCSRCRTHHSCNRRFHKSRSGNLCIVDRLRRRGGCWRSGECRTRQRCFKCQRIVNGGTEIRIIVNGCGYFFQRVQRGWRTINKGRQCRLYKRSGRNLRGIIPRRWRWRFGGSGKCRAGFWRVL